jgi:hypothetical protein
MVFDPAYYRVRVLGFSVTATRRAALIKNSGADNGCDHAAPIGDRIPEERAPMRVRVGSQIKQYPAQQDDRRNKR